MILELLHIPFSHLCITSGQLSPIYTLCPSIKDNANLKVTTENGDFVP